MTSTSLISKSKQKKKKAEGRKIKESQKIILFIFFLLYILTIQKHGPALMEFSFVLNFS